MISEKQKAEWTENPVTIELLKLIDNEIEEILLTPTGSCLHYGDPNKTHEDLIKQDIRAHTFATLSFALRGDWGYFEEQEDEE